MIHNKNSTPIKTPDDTNSNTGFLYQKENLNEKQIAKLAEKLSKQEEIKNIFISLEGELGAGKTTFTRYLLTAMGVKTKIKSPTYSIMQQYEVNSIIISHFDFYRFTDPQEWEEAGFREIFISSGLKIAEWCEKVISQLPKADITIKLISNIENENYRAIKITSDTEIGDNIIKKILD